MVHTSSWSTTISNIIPSQLSLSRSILWDASWVEMEPYKNKKIKITALACPCQLLFLLSTICRSNLLFFVSLRLNTLLLFLSTPLDFPLVVHTSRLVLLPPALRNTNTGCYHDGRAVLKLLSSPTRPPPPCCVLRLPCMPRARRFVVTPQGFFGPCCGNLDPLYHPKYTAFITGSRHAQANIVRANIWKSHGDSRNGSLHEFHSDLLQPEFESTVL